MGTENHEMNGSGFIPVGNRVIVRPDPVEEKTESGLIKTVNAEKEKHGQQDGVLVGIGPLAWQYPNDDGLEYKPWAYLGDRVHWTRYSGLEITGDDGEFYRIMNDEDLIARKEVKTNG